MLRQMRCASSKALMSSILSIISLNSSSLNLSKLSMFPFIYETRLTLVYEWWFLRESLHGGGCSEDYSTLDFIIPEPRGSDKVRHCNVCSQCSRNTSSVTATCMACRVPMDADSVHIILRHMEVDRWEFGRLRWLIWVRYVDFVSQDT